jgi:glycosyltransferase involved in cell wall biosynthesis
VNHPALYAAFDLYPSAKGAATHIYHAAGTLFDTMGGGLLYVLGNEKMPAFQYENPIEINRFNYPIPNYLYRAQAFSLSLRNRVKQEKSLQLVQFRDIWSGASLLEEGRPWKTIFEVNGLPSVELPYRYPDLETETLEKLRESETKCMTLADRLLCPSGVIRDYLIRDRGMPAEKITVISNGAEPVALAERLPEIPNRYILYFGALQAWQGLDDLLRAMRHLLDFDDLKLVICASNRPKFGRQLEKYAVKLGLEDRVIWKHQLSKEELSSWIFHASMTIAPLQSTRRNLEQGCCPLKILESLAHGVPVIASEMPAVKELMADGEGGKLIRPGRPAELAQAIRFYLDFPDEAKKAGQKGLEKIRESYTWPDIRAAYRNLLEKTLKS